MKYQALMEDREIFLNFLEAIFKKEKRIHILPIEVEEKFNKDVLEMVDMGFSYRVVADTLNITTYRVEKAVQLRKLEMEENINDGITRDN